MVDSDLMVVADLTVDIELDDRHKLDRRCKLEKPSRSSCRAFSFTPTDIEKSSIGVVTLKKRNDNLSAKSFELKCEVI